MIYIKFLEAKFKTCLIYNILCKIMQQKAIILSLDLTKSYTMELTRETMLYGLSYYFDSGTDGIPEVFDRYNRQKVFMLAKKFFLLNDIVPDHHNMFRFEQLLRAAVPCAVVNEPDVLNFIKKCW